VRWGGNKRRKKGRGGEKKGNGKVKQNGSEGKGRDGREEGEKGSSCMMKSGQKKLDVDKILILVAPLSTPFSNQRQICLAALYP